MSLPNRTTGDPTAPARCVDCGQDIAEEDIFRVLRRSRDGQRHVVCQPCADRRHAEAKPAPLQVQRTPPPPSVLTGKRLERKSPAAGG